MDVVSQEDSLLLIQSSHDFQVDSVDIHAGHPDEPVPPVVRVHHGKDLLGLLEVMSGEACAKDFDDNIVILVQPREGDVRSDDVRDCRRVVLFGESEQTGKSHLV